ncbi:alpha-ketoacid dehydrogenase subunit beta [Nocardioides cavernae]|uniref:Alpha-ketoacid dehydrogenase subunit beta n=1 Tax=Nocardioides cavernae TaxID=1921566 RepID=A0ABR8NBM6_9ACTN|nr:transketolase C-terminal domain-containing protein [Nocardioides cavernae]MBD3924269.1 alpha-ketoacid dehydrogenase subunit beta [Nocardioides cavernae]MBM7510792.1 pyruvate dehydrogenase E1 component beta subunit [Nocardioides cavernae]
MTADTTTETVAGNFGDALAAAQQDAMRLDPSIVLMGQDIEAGFPFGATKALVDEFGAERVRNTPISEAATMGFGVGAALAGARPVVEVDFSGFLLLGMDQLINNAAKLRYMSGNQVSVPLVVRVGQGPLGSFAAQHSQTQHAYLSSIPGLVVLVPSSPQAAYDAMRWALTQSDTVVLLEDMRLYRRTGTFTRGEVPDDVQPVVIRSGTTLSVITYGYGVTLATQAASVLAEEGIDLDIVSLERMSPLDSSVMVQSARRTGRVLCLTDDPPAFGVGSTLSAVITAQANDALELPPVILGSKPVPTPYTPDLEALVFPSVESVCEAARRLAAWNGEA